jgi:RNA recognition motif. (a.k.a. RRM, RBD, or RNP domain)
MAMNTTAPQSINLHFDNMGVFRGMAFIKYRSLDDAIKVYEALNGYDVGGRKVRVEYKRKNKGQQLGMYWFSCFIVMMHLTPNGYCRHTS